MSKGSWILALSMQEIVSLRLGERRGGVSESVL